MQNHLLHLEHSNKVLTTDLVGILQSDDICSHLLTSQRERKENLNKNWFIYLGVQQLYGTSISCGKGPKNLHTTTVLRPTGTIF